MNNTIKRLAALLLIAALVLALSGCGGEKKEQAPAETAQPVAEAAVTEAPKATETPAPAATVENTEEAGAADGTAAGDGANLDA